MGASSGCDKTCFSQNEKVSLSQREAFEISGGDGGESNVLQALGAGLHEGFYLLVFSMLLSNDLHAIRFEQYGYGL
jgi:hypothetical protein